MAYENIQIDHSNFCIGPTAGHFCTLDYDNDDLLFKNSTGTTIRTYDLDTAVSEIKSIEYTGPRGLGLAQTQLGTDMPFFTLERDNNGSQCTIREWRLDGTNADLNLENTITKQSSGSYYFNCYDMAVEHYLTDFDSPGGTVTGTGYITPTDISRMSVGDRLLLGPSSDVTNQYATEWVEITAISGSNVYIDSITSSGVVPPLNEYADEDDITFTKAIYLFSDIGENNDSNGGLYKIHPYTGNVLEVHNNGIYHSNGYPSTWSAAAWSIDYDAVGFVRGVNLLYVDPNNNYERSNSQTLTNIDDEDAEPFEVYDLIFDTNAIYRLQRKTTLRDDNGDKITTSWSTHNYHLDSIIPYTLSVDITPDSRASVQHGGTITLNVVVRDQFGVGLSGKTVNFSSTETGGTFSPSPNRTTDVNGRASVNYTTDSYDYLIVDENFEVVVISARSDGSSATIVGSAYIWDELDIILHKRFQFQRDLLRQIDDEFESDVRLQQLDDVEADIHTRVLTKFQFPGGHWSGGNPPSDAAAIIKQLEEFESDQHVVQIDDEFENEMHLEQLKDKSHDLQISQPYISRHLVAGHIDTAIIDQFQFVQELRPPAWSEKNPVDTDIYQKLRPFGFDLNPATLVYKLREVSYAGDTGYYDITTATVSGFDAGGGLQGLEIFYDPPQSFHHNAIVYVSIEVYDLAPTPNLIILDYWFRIIPDFRTPYIENEYPAREEEDVSINTNISFDILDAGAGVDIDTLEFYVNNRRKYPTSSGISGGYHITYAPTQNFFYGETVEITVKVNDIRGNTLYDMWRFYCVGSTGPWIDRDSFYPRSCQEGIRRRTDYISANIYGIDDTGVDRSSILIHIGGKERGVKIRPIIYRSS